MHFDGSMTLTCTRRSMSVSFGRSCPVRAISFGGIERVRSQQQTRVERGIARLQPPRCALQITAVFIDIATLRHKANGIDEAAFEDISGLIRRSACQRSGNASGTYFCGCALQTGKSEVHVKSRGQLCCGVASNYLSQTPIKIPLRNSNNVEQTSQR